MRMARVNDFSSAPVCCPSLVVRPPKVTSTFQPSPSSRNVKSPTSWKWKLRHGVGGEGGEVEVMGGEVEARGELGVGGQRRKRGGGGGRAVRLRLDPAATAPRQTGAPVGNSGSSSSSRWCTAALGWLPWWELGWAALGGNQPCSAGCPSPPPQPGQASADAPRQPRRPVHAHLTPPPAAAAAACPAAKCILHWALHKEEPWCPQCKRPFTHLLTYRTLDGTLQVRLAVCWREGGQLAAVGLHCQLAGRQGRVRPAWRGAGGVASARFLCV